jgi:hypothetical protein
MLAALRALPLLAQLALGAGAVLGLGGVAAGAYAVVWHQGYASAESACNAAELEAQIKSLQFNLHLAQAAAAAAQQLADAADDRASTLDERLQAYEDQTDAPAICALDDAGASRLLELTR